MPKSPPSPDVPVLAADLAPTLVVMVNQNLGNLCISMPVLERLTRYFDEPAELLVDERYAALTETALPGRRVIPAPRATLPSVGLAARIAARGYRAVIDVSGGIRSTALVASTRAQWRIGLDSSRRGWLYSHRVATAGAVHTLDRYARILACIGEPGERPPPTGLTASDEDRAAVRRLLEERLGAGPGPIVSIHCGAGQTFRLWPPERFAAVADGLVERCGARICFIGAPSERPLMERVRARMKHGDLACLVHLPLVQLGVLLESSSLMLGNESGPMHVAAMTDVPIAAIFGPTKEARWAPSREAGVVTLRGADCRPGCRKGGVCTEGFRCLTELTVDRVLQASGGLLENALEPQRR